MRRRSALLVVDVQIDFCPGGALAVPKGDLIILALNSYLGLFKEKGAPIFASRDWHPEGSKHFLGHGGIWPPHCIQRSRGAGFHPGLMLPEGTIVVSKGQAEWDNGYSAMQGVTENGTPLNMLLHRMGVDKLYIGGLATDYCVKESALEALRDGFGVTLLADAVQAVELRSGDGERAVAAMVEAGADLATLATIGSRLLADRDGGLQRSTVEPL